MPQIAKVLIGIGVALTVFSGTLGLVSVVNPGWGIGPIPGTIIFDYPSGYVVFPIVILSFVGLLLGTSLMLVCWLIGMVTKR